MLNTKFTMNIKINKTDNLPFFFFKKGVSSSCVHKKNIQITRTYRIHTYTASKVCELVHTMRFFMKYSLQALEINKLSLNERPKGVKFQNLNTKQILSINKIATCGSKKCNNSCIFFLPDRSITA